MILYNKLLGCYFLLLFWVMSDLQAQGSLFDDFSKQLDAEIENIIRDNSKGNWISEIEIEDLREAANYTFKPNIFLYDFLIDQGVRDCDDNFEVVYFTFFWFEFPPNPVVFIVYKHIHKEIYKKVSISIDRTDDLPLGSIKGCSYFTEFLDELNVEYKLGPEYQSVESLGFYGFGVHFTDNKIKKVKVFHDCRYLSVLTKVSSRKW